MSVQLKALGELLEPSGQHRAGSQDLPVLSITMKHGLVDQTDKFKKRVASLDTSNYRVAYRGELVVGFPIDEGVLGFQVKYPAGIVSPAYDIWKLKSAAKCHIPYLQRYLRSAQARSLYATRMQGAVARRRSLTKPDFLSLEVPLPSHDDQIRIAHLLGKVEGLIAQRKQHLQQLDDLLKSVFLEMFGDPVRNERGWDKPALKAFGKISTGNTPPRNDPTNFDRDFIEWIKTDNIAIASVFVTRSAEHLSEIGAGRGRIVSSGALLVACIAGSVESIGRAALTDRKVAFNQQINAIQPNADVSPLYLYGLFKLSRPYIQSHATKGMKKILTKGDFEQIAMIKPPLDLQNQFAEIVTKVENLKARKRQSLTDLEALYGTLSQRAFKGELDLSRIPLPEVNAQPQHDPYVAPPESAAPLPRPEGLMTPSKVINHLVQQADPQAHDEPLARWFQHYLANTLPDAFLGSRQMLEAAWQTLQADRLEEDGHTPAQTLADYDALKDLIFKALEGGELMQSFDGQGNRVALQRRPEKPRV